MNVCVGTAEKSWGLHNCSDYRDYLDFCCFDVLARSNLMKERMGECV